MGNFNPIHLSLINLTCNSHKSLIKFPYMYQQIFDLTNFVSQTENEKDSFSAKMYVVKKKCLMNVTKRQFGEEKFVIRMGLILIKVIFVGT